MARGPAGPACEHGTVLSHPTIFCERCVQDWQTSRSSRTRSDPALGSTSVPDGELVTRLHGVDNLGHDAHTGTHTHAHLSHGGPDSDGDGIHAHQHSHSGHAGHDHVHPPGTEDSVYAESVAAGTPGDTPASSSGRKPYGVLAGADRELLMLGLPPGADQGVKYIRAIELRDQTALDWDRATRAMYAFRERTGGFDFANARHLDPAQRTAYVRALEVESAARDCERRYWAAERLVQRLDEEEQALMRPDLGLLHRPDYEEPIMIRGRRSLGLSDPGPRGPEPTREFISPVGLTGGRRAEPVDPGALGIGDGQPPPPRDR